MVAYSFQRRFVGPIRSGAKAQTVRADRKRHARQGEALQLYTGMRTTNCKLIGRAICASVEPIRFDFDAQDVTIGANPPMTDLAQLDAFSQADGFEDFRGLVEFWRDHHSGVQQWEGVLIRWRDFQKAPGL